MERTSGRRTYPPPQPLVVVCIPCQNAILFGEHHENIKLCRYRHSPAASVAQAAPVTWTVPATTLPDGAVVGGTFVYDTATGTISNLNITQTVQRPGSYTFAASFPNVFRGGQRTAVTAVGDETWFLRVDAIPANGGAYTSPRVGTGACVSATGGVCNSAQTTNGVANVVITGVLVATAAPVPTLSEWAMILFGTILAGGAALYIQRRRIVA